MASNERGSTWSTVEVLSLLEIWGEQKIQTQLNGAKRNIRVYETISAELSLRGFDRSSHQCRSKIKSLKVEYKKEKDRLSRSGAARAITFKFFEVMDRLLGERPSSRPEFTLDLGLPDTEDDDPDAGEPFLTLDENVDEEVPVETNNENERRVEDQVNLQVNQASNQLGTQINDSARRHGKRRQRDNEESEVEPKKKKKATETMREIAAEIMQNMSDMEERFQERRLAELRAMEEARMRWEEEMEERRRRENQEQMTQFMSLIREIFKK